MVCMNIVCTSVHFHTIGKWRFNKVCACVKGAQVHIRNFVTSFTEYNKDKVPMDVAISLVVNHVNIGVLCLFELYLCLCV